ncbi:hypothetical protein MTR_7g005740 [Medicago truncatula]|uniref:Uncharacterized protein n=1 Tax=Medicago truncatula TaxID=3880 RepID=G7KWM5_MEDTR|nr:hypothetical protein MTR_7g005740 [Medicago truncatula]
MSSGELGCIYATLILHDDGIPITPSLFAKLAQSKNIDDLILNSGAVAGAAVAEPAAVPKLAHADSSSSSSQRSFSEHYMPTFGLPFFIDPEDKKEVANPEVESDSSEEIGLFGCGTSEEDSDIDYPKYTLRDKFDIRNNGAFASDVSDMSDFDDFDCIGKHYSKEFDENGRKFGHNLEVDYRRHYVC